MQRDFLLQFSIDIYFFSLSLTRCSLCMLKKMLEEGKDFFFGFVANAKTMEFVDISSLFSSS